MQSLESTHGLVQEGHRNTEAIHMINLNLHGSLREGSLDCMVRSAAEAFNSVMACSGQAK
jgi:hypothetical protein